MKDSVIVSKLVKWGYTIRVICVVLACLVVLGGFILAEQATHEEGSFIMVFYVFAIYATALIAAGFINELIFNWMAAVLRNLSKQ